MRVAIYARVSTSRQEREGYSLQEQSSRLEKYCDIREWEVSKHYIDGGYSGANLDRPAIKQLIEDCSIGLFDMVLVYKLDRISRSQRDVLFLIEDVFLKHNVEFASLTENLDTSTAMGRAMISILATFAALERAQIAERTAIGVAGRAKKGYWHGADKSPIGYEYVDGELVVNDFEAMLLRKAFDMFVDEGRGVTGICKEFARRGYKTRYGYMLPSSLNKIMNRRLYIGKIEKDGEIYDGRHEAIIDESKFEEAQRIFRKRRAESESGKNAFRATSYLGGLIRCRHCGAKYGKSLGHKKLDGTKSRFYVCNSRSKKNPSAVMDPGCRNKIWRMDELDRVVFNEITKLSLDPRYIEDISAKEPERNDDDTEVLKARIDELTDQISRYTDLFSIRQLDMNELREKIDPLTDQREALRREVDMLQEDCRQTSEHAYEVARTFGDVLEGGDFDRIRFVIQELIDFIEIDGDKVRIHWTFA